MSLFRIDPDQPFKGPHQNQKIITGGADINSAQVAMILIHGRGATAESMLTFANQIERNDIHYRALQASNYTWYPRSFMAPKTMNEPGISSGLQAIYDAIISLNKANFPSEKIVLLGFSQGACLTAEFAARHPQKFGGVFGLSGGLIGQEIEADLYQGSLERTPVFLGCSDSDPHIPEERVDETAAIFEKMQADVNEKIYPGMGHTVNRDEIRQINKVLEKL
ncbi:MAG TPA: dienelactone hydrolase family protein [Balneolaceae bacterium]|nr:dienelactone hydrolase family protein [Balneolaceae bacterium]